MASTCFERTGFSLYGRDSIGCVPGGTLISNGRREHAPQSSLDGEKMSAYSLSVALRASMAPMSHPGAFRAKFICRMWWGTVLPRRRNNPR